MVRTCPGPESSPNLLVFPHQLTQTHHYHQIWHIFEGGHLFSGRDPEHAAYRSRAHLGEMIALLGPPPPSLLAWGHRSGEFFNLSTGEFCAGISLPATWSLEDRETTLAGSGQQQDRASFLRLMRKMLHCEPGKRSSARELMEDEWIRKHTGGG